MPFIQVIQPEQAGEDLRRVYEEISGSRGKLAEVHKIQSLNPESITAHMQLYKVVMFGRSPVSRAEREMVAVVVSATNKCSYCIQHHLEALKHFWSPEAAGAVACGDYEAARLTERQEALCRYAAALTREPAGAPAHGEWAASLRGHGLEDRGILDLTLVIGYFNFVNRVVLGLGVELEQDPGGYRYE